MRNLICIFLFLTGTAFAETQSEATAKKSTQTSSTATGESLQIDLESINPAQEAIDSAQINPESTASSNDVEKITVTGSRIKRIDLEGPNPITVYSAEDLEISGYHSVGDFLRNTTLSGFGVSRGTAGNSNSGESFIEVKGEPTLILLNGLRIAEDPEAHVVDLNLIPMNAIERIEVLRNGGSAIYGSDALGGVINFITKKDFSGTELHASVTPTLYPLWQGNFNSSIDDYLAGSSANAGAVFGTNGSDWSVIGALNLRYQENIISNQREWGKDLKSSISPKAFFYNPSDRSIVETNCKEDPNPLGQIECRFDYTPFADFIPKYAQSNLFIQGNYETNNVQLYSQFLGSYKLNQYHFAPLPVNEGMKPTFEIPTDHSLAFGQGQALRLRHRFMDAGRRNTFTQHWLADLTVGAKGYVSKTWDYDASLKVAHIIKNRTEQNVLLLDKTVEAIKTGTYDPLNPSKDGLQEAIYTAKSKNNSSLISGSLDLSGDTPLGFDVATGIQAYWQRYQNEADSANKKGKYGNIIAGVGSDGAGSRWVASPYVEAVKNFKEQFELQLAYRADYYSDFGFSNFGIRELFEIDNLEFLDYLIGTPKIAFRFQPLSNVMFRGSVSSAFKAPELSTLYGSSSSSFPYLVDTISCIEDLNSFADADLNSLFDSVKKVKELFNLPVSEIPSDSVTKTTEVLKNKDLLKKLIIHEEHVSKHVSNTEGQQLENVKDYVDDLKILTSSCGLAQYSADFQPNPNLKPTQALSASVGSVLELTPDFNINLDIGYIQKNGVPSSGLADSDGSGKKLFDAEALGKQGLIDELGIAITRNNDGRLEQVSTKYSNLQKSRKLFVDLGLKTNLSSIPVPSGAFYFNNDLTVFLIHQSEDFPDLGLENQIGEFGNPRWVNRVTVGWKNKKQHVFVNAFSVAPFKGTSFYSFRYFPLSTRFDLNYEYLLSEKTRLNVNLYNFLNLGLNFYNKNDSLVSISLDNPADMTVSNRFPVDARINSKIHNIHGAHFNIRLSHLL